jgi:hypothetical protein
MQFFAETGQKTIAIPTVRFGGRLAIWKVQRLIVPGNQRRFVFRTPPLEPPYK